MPRHKGKQKVDKARRRVCAKETMQLSKVHAMTVDEEKFNASYTQIMNDPAFQIMRQQMEIYKERRIAEAQDSAINLKNERGYVIPEELLQFPNSPTAQRHLFAFELYLEGWSIIYNYQKSGVLTEADCRQIEKGFHSYIRGFMMEDHMSRQFPLIRDVTELLRQYMGLRPHDTLAEYLYIVLDIWLNPDLEGDDYVRSKTMIRAFEEFAHKLEPYKANETERLILCSVFYFLGAKYYTTDQKTRSKDCFKKRHELDEENLYTLYSLGMSYIHDEPEVGRKFLEKFLERAPICHEKYPHAHYLLGVFYLSHSMNIRLAKKYYRLGKEAETFRLPFNTPTDIPAKWTLGSALQIYDLKENKPKEITHR